MFTHPLLDINSAQPLNVKRSRVGRARQLGCSWGAIFKEDSSSRPGTYWLCPCRNLGVGASLNFAPQVPHSPHPGPCRENRGVCCVLHRDSQTGTCKAPRAESAPSCLRRMRHQPASGCRHVTPSAEREVPGDRDSPPCARGAEPHPGTVH